MSASSPAPHLKSGRYPRNPSVSRWVRLELGNFALATIRMNLPGAVEGARAAQLALTRGRGAHFARSGGSFWLSGVAPLSNVRAEAASRARGASC